MAAWAGAHVTGRRRCKWALWPRRQRRCCGRVCGAPPSGGTALHAALMRRPVVACAAVCSSWARVERVRKRVRACCLLFSIQQILLSAPRVAPSRAAPSPRTRGEAAGASVRFRDSRAGPTAARPCGPPRGHVAPRARQQPTMRGQASSPAAAQVRPRLGCRGMWPSRWCTSACSVRGCGLKGTRATQRKQPFLNQEM
eukprot:364069-Chlamydomonas_euryale.AAC.9